MRLFIALGLPDDIADQLIELYGPLPGARWTHPDDLHLTLRFLGPTDASRSRDVHELLECLRFPAFSLSLSGVGFFPPRGHPHSLWTGVQASEPLERLQSKVSIWCVRPGRRRKSAISPRMSPWLGSIAPRTAMSPPSWPPTRC